MSLIKCPNCGEEISDTAEKCIHCGIQLKQKQEKEIKCPECGTVFVSSEMQCPKCGYSVEKIKQTKKKINNFLTAICVALVASIICVLYYNLIYLPKVVPINTMEQMITEIGTVSENSDLKIKKAEEYYASLTDEQKTKVNNYDTLIADRERYDKMVADKKAISEVIEKIKTLEEIEYPMQEDIDKVQSQYDKLTNEQKKKVTNYDLLKKAQELKPYELYAVKAAKALQCTLKNADSFKIREISFKESDEQTFGAGYVKISYSATNSYGAAMDDLDCIDITEDGNVGLWLIGILAGNMESTGELQAYNISKGHEYQLDPVRIMNNLK